MHTHTTIEARVLLLSGSAAAAAAAYLPDVEEGRETVSECCC
jgi:hypothetical protein